VKKISMSLAINEIKIKTTLRFYFIPVKMEIINQKTAKILLRIQGNMST
jgi:hypothetical protein